MALFGLRFRRGPQAETGPAPNNGYQLGVDSLVRAGVPKGQLRQLPLPPSAVYPGYAHAAWLYLPAGHAPGEPLSLMVFLDGHHLMAPEGPWRAPTVLDNLIADRGLPPMAAVFINAGTTAHDHGLASEQRSLEYDTVGGDYPEFLTREVFPEIARFAVIADDPAARGIAGVSSGGICAFNAAWRRPDVFSKVFSAIGSFVDIRGGGAYPSIVEASDRKALRVFLQDGVHNSLSGQFDGLDWTAGNRAMARALAARGYDYQLVMGRAGHTPEHGGAIFPAAMRWLWRDHPRA
jgi:enterochelin esterase-like enzyme